MHDFVGRWRIRSMETWAQDYVDLVEPGYFQFDSTEMGEFVSGAVKGWLDVRVSTGEPQLEFSWQGESEGDELCGRGWFRFVTANSGEGMLFIHCGDESGVRIERED